MADRDIVVLNEDTQALEVTQPGDRARALEDLVVSKYLHLGGVPLNQWPTVSAPTGNLALTLTGGTYVLSAAEAVNVSIDVSGTLTANQIIEVPAGTAAAHIFIFNNLTTGAFTLSVRVTGGAILTPILQGTRGLVYSTGTELQNVTIPGPVTSVAGKTGAVTLTTTDIANSVISVMGKTGVVTLIPADISAAALDVNGEVIQLPAGASTEATLNPRSVLRADGSWGLPRAGVTEMSASAPTAVATTTWTRAPLDTVDIDTNGAADTVGNTITIPASLNGLYAKIEAHIRWPVSNAGTLRSRVVKNGAALTLSYFGKPTTGVNQSITQDVICPVQYLVTGDVFTFEVYHNLGSNLTPVTLRMRLVLLGA